MSGPHILARGVEPPPERVRELRKEREYGSYLATVVAKEEALLTLLTDMRHRRGEFEGAPNRYVLDRLLEVLIASVEEGQVT